MPITLTKIASNVAQVSFSVGEDTVHIEYYPARVTEKTFAQLQAFSAMDETTLATGFAGFNSLLAHLIRSWDVYEDDEETVMFPLEPDRFAELPIAFRIQVMTSILSDIRPEAIAPQTT